MDTAKPESRRVDMAWLAILTVIGGGVSVVLADTLFDLSIFFSGIFCVGLTAIGRREGYLVGLYNSLAYSVLAYRNGLFGEVYLNLYFFVPTGVIGYFMWNRHLTATKTVVMRQLAWRHRGFVAASCLVCTVGLGWLLGLNPKQNTPYIDASTNVLSVVATFLMMWRFKEQWILYILLNIVTILMWWLRYMAGGASGDLMVLMWSVFLLNAIFGYWRWHTGAKRSAEIDQHQATREPVCDVA